jgi:hypothetical protein
LVVRSFERASIDCLPVRAVACSQAVGKLCSSLRIPAFAGGPLQMPDIQTPGLDASHDALVEADKRHPPRVNELQLAHNARADEAQIRLKQWKKDLK